MGLIDIATAAFWVGHQFALLSKQKYSRHNKAHVFVSQFLYCMPTMKHNATLSSNANSNDQWNSQLKPMYRKLEDGAPNWAGNDEINIEHFYSMMSRQICIRSYTMYTVQDLWGSLTMRWLIIPILEALPIDFKYAFWLVKPAAVISPYLVGLKPSQALFPNIWISASSIILCQLAVINTCL